jgi:ribosome-binding factor A
MESTRQQKVSRLIQKELGEIFQQKGTSISEGKMVTVTVVRMSPDLSVAKVYLSFFPPQQKSESLDLVRKHVREIRFELGERVGKQLRVVPELALFTDDSAEYAANIDRILKTK